MHPRQSKSHFKEYFLLGGEIGSVGVVNLTVLAYVLRATTKKKVVNFSRKKCTHREKILATPMSLPVCLLGYILLSSTATVAYLRIAEAFITYTRKCGICEALQLRDRPTRRRASRSGLLGS